MDDAARQLMEIREQQKEKENEAINAFATESQQRYDRVAELLGYKQPKSNENEEK